MKKNMVSLISSLIETDIQWKHITQHEKKTENPIHQLPYRRYALLMGSELISKALTCMKIYLCNKKWQFVKETDTSGFIGFIVV